MGWVGAFEETGSRMEETEGVWERKYGRKRMGKLLEGLGRGPGEICWKYTDSMSTRELVRENRNCQFGPSERRKTG